MVVQQMLETHPRQTPLDNEILTECIEACFACAQACTTCADACLGEDQVQNLVRCIRLNQDCADICTITGRILSRQTEADWNQVRRQLSSLAHVAKACGDECERHAEMHEHCRICMESCRRCADTCDNVLSELQSVVQA